MYVLIGRQYSRIPAFHREGFYAHPLNLLLPAQAKNDGKVPSPDGLKQFCQRLQHDQEKLLSY